MRHTNFISSAIILTFVFLFAESASAQYSIPIPAPPRPQLARCTAVPTTYIRNLKYDDYTRYSRLTSNIEPLGGYIQINTRCLVYSGQVVVTLQDVNRPTNGYGVTAFRLTNVSYGPNGVTAQLPTHPIFKGRTFHVALFVYGGQPWKTASPGTIKIQ